MESSGGSPLLDVVVKLAFDSAQQDPLTHEYEMYRCLRSKEVVEGIMMALGSFDNFKDGPCALVMLYAGISLGSAEQVLLVCEWWVP